MASRLSVTQMRPHSLKTCDRCGFSSEIFKEFCDHLKECKIPGKFLCPGCPAKYARRDDLVRRHLVDRHPELIVKVKNDRSVIVFEPATENPDEPPVKKMRFAEDVLAEVSLQTAISPLRDEYTIMSPPQDAPEYHPTPLEQTQVVEDLALGESMIDENLPDIDILPAGDLLTDDWQQDPLVNWSKAMEMATAVAKVMGEEIVKGMYPERGRVLCPHGVRLPVHVHRQKTITHADGSTEHVTETQVFCAECKPPTLHLIQKK